MLTHKYIFQMIKGNGHMWLFSEAAKFMRRTFGNFHQALDGYS
jgi:hypothetical protein